MTQGITTQEMINDIQDHGAEITEWESNFVSDIGDKLAKGYTLSDKQLNKLRKIYNERVG